SSSAASSSAVPEEPTPVGKLWTAQWKDADLTNTYTKKCKSSSSYKAQIYELGEMYPALKTWAPELKVFYNKQHYPGSWEGEDAHGEGRTLLKMEYEELPYAVREWLLRNPKQRHYSVQEDIVFFAPGAIYPIAPLWVEESETESKSALGECEGVLEDLENYSATAKDGVVLGHVSHSKTGKNEVEFSVEAFQISEKKGKEERDE
ncbi:hypothetical protein P280DRAFT_374215, partial [Massarina eburnea CBS 473.64]